MNVFFFFFKKKEKRIKCRVRLDYSSNQVFPESDSILNAKERSWVENQEVIFILKRIVGFWHGEFRVMQSVVVFLRD